MSESIIDWFWGAGSMVGTSGDGIESRLLIYSDHITDSTVSLGWLDGLIFVRQSICIVYIDTANRRAFRNHMVVRESIEG